jgi:Glycogen recognition site of AMP-activated protein kinase/Carbohydrate-binding module 48 (Isoamylase N-terminal domain)
MKYYFLVAIHLLTFGFISAQKDTVSTAEGRFFWDDGLVVFEFNEQGYAQALARSDSQYVAFTDLDLLGAIREPDLTIWQEEGWQLRAKPNGYYQLCKPITNFKDQPNWLLRLLAQGVNTDNPDSLVVAFKAEGWYALTAERITRQIASDSGNVVFRLNGFTEAQQVMLSGSFNLWNETALRMRKTDWGWELKLNLAPGQYEYKFIADGKWMEDPANPDHVVNQHGTLNSILKVHRMIRFKLQDFMDAKQVFLAGTFNDWNPTATPMQLTPDGWVVEIPLTDGKYLYKYVVDERWTTDPRNKRQEEDGNGNVNSVMLVR